MINKLLKVQKELKAPKNQYNPFGKYNYRNCEDILEAAKPLLAENGLMLTVKDEIVLIGERYYIKATATVTDGEASMSTSAFAREEETQKGMTAAQLTGSTSSYARKYALNGLFCIDDNKDDDDRDNTEKGENNANQNKTKLQADYCCENCGTPFKDTTIKGKKITAEQQFMLAIQNRGKAICKKCSDAMKAAQNEG